MSSDTPRSQMRDLGAHLEEIHSLFSFASKSGM